MAGSSVLWITFLCKGPLSHRPRRFRTPYQNGVLAWICLDSGFVHCIALPNAWSGVFFGIGYLFAKAFRGSLWRRPQKERLGHID